MCEDGNRGRHLRELGSHAAAVVDDQAHGYWRVFVLEDGDVLAAARRRTRVKFWPAQPRYEIPVPSVTLTGNTTNSVFTKSRIGSIREWVMRP